jgi:hypothetical protein
MLEWAGCPNVVTNHSKSFKHRNEIDLYQELELYDSEVSDSGNDDPINDYYINYDDELMVTKIILPVTNFSPWKLQKKT